MKIVPQFIPDLFGAVVGAVDAVFSTRSADPFRVYYDFGHYAEVTKNLVEKDSSITKKNTKFPLIWLVTDFVENMGSGNDNYYAQASPLTIFIAVSTDVNYSGTQRRDKSFLPRLYPIYAELLNQLSDSSAFGMPQILPHLKIDRPYWGTQDAQGNGTANMFGTYCDAIEIKNVKLSVNKIC
jgi:hypothetical protein